LEVDDEAHPSNQIHGRNQRKTPSNSRIKNHAKILQKSRKRKMIHTTLRRDSRTKIGYIDRIKHLQGVKTITASSHSLEDWRDLSLSLLSCPLLSSTMKHSHTSQKATMARGWKWDG
jgi:hypothetical protein